MFKLADKLENSIKGFSRLDDYAKEAIAKLIKGGGDESFVRRFAQSMVDDLPASATKVAGRAALSATPLAAILGLVLGSRSLNEGEVDMGGRHAPLPASGRGPMGFTAEARPTADLLVGESEYIGKGLAPDLRVPKPYPLEGDWRAPRPYLGDDTPSQGPAIKPRTPVPPFDADAEELAAGAGVPVIGKQVGGVAGEPVDIATSGLMGGAAPEIQAAVAERDMVMPAPDQPQNAEERAVFDQALLALQGELEPEPAQAAITEFIDTFGPEAFRQLQALVSGERESGGLVQPANGETTVGMTEEEAMAQQGPDVIPGKIVDPTTGKQTANLLVGENEYIEPADSLSRRAMAAGMAGTPQNGAIVRGREEEQLRRAYG